tara:strand:- start:20913 stop:21434 length:522 start_codon:yes stop_codon:yes gene_type:complete
MTETGCSSRGHSTETLTDHAMTDMIEILNNRRFTVDRATLFDAFADPQKLELWWGPEGFTNHISSFDLKPGGHWLITMTADNGTDFHNRWTFEDVVEGRMVLMTHHEPVHVFTLEMRFADEDDGARLSWRMVFDRTDQNEAMEKFLHAANEQNFDRLQRLLDRTDGSRPPLPL